MGDQADYDSTRYDYPADPPGAPNPNAKPRSASSLREQNHAYAVKIKRADPRHAQCPGAPRYDPELGVMCFCTEIIGPPSEDDLLADPAALPPSTVSAAAAAAKPLEVAAPEQAIKDIRGVSSAVHPADPIMAEIDIIDPTAPYDSAMVEQHLLDAVRRLEQGSHYERVCAEDYADKVMRYELAYNRKRVEAKQQVGGSEGDREAWARVECETQYLDREIAKLKLKAIQGTMHSLRSVISAYQSVMKSISTAYTGTPNSGPRF